MLSRVNTKYFSHRIRIWSLKIKSRNLAESFLEFHLFAFPFTEIRSSTAIPVPVEGPYNCTETERHRMKMPKHSPRQAKHLFVAMGLLIADIQVNKHLMALVSHQFLWGHTKKYTCIYKKSGQHCTGEPFPGHLDLHLHRKFHILSYLGSLFSTALLDTVSGRL